MSFRKALISIAAILIAVSAFLLFPESPETGPTDPALLAYYLDTYDASRSALREASQPWLQKHRATSQSLKVPSRSDDDLTIDTLFIPATGRPEKLLIMTSGIHGIEAFVGSAVQRYFLDHILPDLDRTHLGVLIVHAVNPYGFRYERRVSENNVDLNRNWDVSPDLFQSENQGYEMVNALLNPEGRVDLGSIDNRFFALRSVVQIVRHGMPVLRQAILQGQYVHEQGLYFGGKDFEPQKALLEPILLGKAAPYRSILLIDLHTGFGERGRLHLFPNAIRDQATRSRLEEVFHGYRIDYGDTEGFYTTTGDFSEYLGRLLKGKAYLPMVFEYGTMDSQTTSGSIRSLHNMILENQGHWHGYVSEDDRTETRRRFREHYFPSSQIWRTKILKESDAILRRALVRFMGIKD